MKLLVSKMVEGFDGTESSVIVAGTDPISDAPGALMTLEHLGYLTLGRYESGRQYFTIDREDLEELLHSVT